MGVVTLSSMVTVDQVAWGVALTWVDVDAGSTVGACLSAVTGAIDAWQGVSVDEGTGGCFTAGSAESTESQALTLFLSGGPLCPLYYGNPLISRRGRRGRGRGRSKGNWYQGLLVELNDRRG